MEEEENKEAEEEITTAMQSFPAMEQNCTRGARQLFFPVNEVEKGKEEEDKDEEEEQENKEAEDEWMEVGEEEKEEEVEEEEENEEDVEQEEEEGEEIATTMQSLHGYPFCFSAL